jgi:hypothetical protein
MQHLPTLVFRGDDQQLATDALRRSQRLLANPSEAELKSSSDAVDSTGWTWMTWIWRKHLRTMRRKPYFFYVFFYLFWGYKWGCNNVHFLQLFFCRLSEIDHEHDGFNCDANRRFEE